MPKDIIRLDLSPEEAHRMKKVLSGSSHPAKARLIQEIHEQERALALAVKRPQLDELRPLGNQLIRDVHAYLPDHVGAVLLLFTENATVYTGTPGVDRSEAAKLITLMIEKWKAEGTIR